MANVIVLLAMVSIFTALTMLVVASINKSSKMIDDNLRQRKIVYDCHIDNVLKDNRITLNMPDYYNGKSTVVKVADQYKEL